MPLSAVPVYRSAALLIVFINQNKFECPAAAVPLLKVGVCFSKIIKNEEKSVIVTHCLQLLAVGHAVNKIERK